MRTRHAIAPFAALALALGLASCGPATTAADPATQEQAQSPRAVVESMLALARAGDWREYVERHYGEQHKFRPGQDDAGTITARFREHAAEIIAGLEQASRIEPTISEDGSRAEFHLDDGRTFLLHRAADGTWTFHL